jgi:hypothetical protein
MSHRGTRRSPLSCGVRKKPSEPLAHPSIRGYRQMKNPLSCHRRSIPDLKGRRHPVALLELLCHRSIAPRDLDVLQLLCHPRRNISNLEDDRCHPVAPRVSHDIDILKLPRHRRPRRSLPNLKNHRHQSVAQVNVRLDHTSASQNLKIPRHPEPPEEEEESNDENIDEDTDDDPCKHA